MNNNSTNIYNNNLRKTITEKADIVSIIGSYVKLEKKGANFIGLCPFHDDKNPSMSVSPSKRVFKCFSCNTGGDVVTFVSKFKNISTRDAMREIGNSLGISVNVTKKEQERQKNNKYFQICEDASKFYSFFLKHADEAKNARDYLKKRGLDENVISKFNIGLAGGSDEIYKLLLSKNYLPVDMMEVGLVRSVGSSYSDVFRNRIIFPLTDLDGYICGFSGRKYIEGDPDSKYLNTTDTIIFKKGEILYNFHSAKNAIKSSGYVILFEGFMDAIASVRAGLENSIASMGTALTNSQLDAIKKVTNKIVLCYDNDEAGINASLRAISMMNAKGFEIALVSVPDGKDTDEYIKKNGEKALFDLLTKNQVSAMDYIYTVYKNSTNFNDLISKENFKNIIFKNLCMFKSSLIIESTLNKLKDDLNVGIDSLSAEFNEYSDKNKEIVITEAKKIAKNTPKESPTDYSDYAYPKEEKKKDSIDKRTALKAEKMLIYAAFKDKNQCEEIESKLSFAYVDEVNKDILFKLIEYYQTRELMIKEEFYKKLTENEIFNLDKILETIKCINYDYVSDCIDKVRKYPIAKQIEDDKNNGEAKTLDDLNALASSKKVITQLHKRRG